MGRKKGPNRIPSKKKEGLKLVETAVPTNISHIFRDTELATEFKKAMEIQVLLVNKAAKRWCVVTVVSPRSYEYTLC